MWIDPSNSLSAVNQNEFPIREVRIDGNLVDFEKEYDDFSNVFKSGGSQ